MAVMALSAVACSAAAAPRDPGPRALPVSTTGTNRVGASKRLVRIALAENVEQVRVSSTGAWQMYAADGRSPVAMTKSGERWILERDGRSIQAMREDSRPVSARETSVIVRSLDAGGSIAFNGKRWRGDLVISVANQGLLVLNRLTMDDYLQGVVPLEIGTGSARDLAAIEAQAVAARSYAYTHLAGSERPFDMRATVADQVYGGVGAETRAGNDAVMSTTGLVLLYNNRVVNAPYFASCGGSTAEPQDVWRTGSEPYLRRVSDQIPGTDRFYCEGAGKHRWTVRMNQVELQRSLARYLRILNAPAANFTRIDNVAVSDVTPAGRVAVLAIDTDRGKVQLRGNEMRSALRLASGDLLYSTYFSVDVTGGRNGIDAITLIGGGNGHGIGMCQSGAIGRARAGQDFREILRTYYPGTTVSTL